MKGLLFQLVQDILCGVNLQHDCTTSRCNKFWSVSICQERSEMTKLQTSLVYSNSNYILNMYSLHNYCEIQLVMPVGLHTVDHLISNHKEICKAAVRQIHGKKAAVNGLYLAPPYFQASGGGMSLPAFN